MTGAIRGYFVEQDGLTMMKAGPYLISILHKWGAYLGTTEEDTETGAALLPESQRAMWREQRAWASFDLMGDDAPEREAYRVLGNVVLHVVDPRCCGVWIPAQGRLLSNDGTVELELARLQRGY